MATKSKPDEVALAPPAPPPIPLPRRRKTDDPTAGLFRRVRRSLTAWYTGVLALALVIFGVGLYYGEHRTLLGPVEDDLQSGAKLVTGYAQQDPLAFLYGGCQSAVQPEGVSQPLLVLCYNARGQAVVTPGQPNWTYAHFVTHFNDPSFALSAISNGSAEDTVNSGSALGLVRRYAVRAQFQGKVLGAIQVWEPIGGQSSAMDTLLKLLIIFGAGTILISTLGGLFMANRALLPARRAHLRQRNFIADASHELRTPLTMLRANAEVLLRGRNRLPPDDVLLLEDVVTEAEHMSALADAMLNLARLDAGQTHLEHEVVDLSALAGDLARRVQPLAAEKGIGVHVAGQAPVVIIGDPVLLQQAALVLVDNAIKYNAAGGEVQIQTALEGDRAQLQVRDTGIGIAAEHLPHLGERFYRVDKARSREMGGAGLGISIARSVAERHGGTLTLESRPGEGTIATLSLPAAHIPTAS